MWWRDLLYGLFFVIACVLAGYTGAWAADAAPQAEVSDILTLFGALGVHATVAMQIITVCATVLYVCSHLWATFVPAPTVTSSVNWVRVYKFLNGLFANYGNSTNLVPAPAVAAVKAAKDMGLLSVLLVGLLTLGLSSCGGKSAQVTSRSDLDQRVYQASEAFYGQLTLLANYGQLPLCSTATFAACADGPALIDTVNYTHSVYSALLTMDADYQAYKSAGSKITATQILADVAQVASFTATLADKVTTIKKGSTQL